MSLVKPEFGLIFWMLVSFGIIFFLLAKFAWKPILAAISEREKSIEDALSAAANAKKELSNLQAGNEKLLAEARAERDNLLKEARDMKDAIINEAKDKAKQEADKLVENARQAINTEKLAAMADIKNQVAELSLGIADKIVRQNLSSDAAQKTLVTDILKDIKFN
jgi:F-type H+-transporting ATPase subunit b